MTDATASPAIDLSGFPVTARWPARHPGRIQLYSRPTPNGIKVAVALEELGLPYEPHLLSFADRDQFTPEFRSLNPNSKIPAIIDPDGPDGAPLPLFESGAILIYLAEKTGRLIGQSPRERYIILQWLMFQMGGIGPFFGQLGHFHSQGGADIEDPRPRQRYVNEARHLLSVLETRLEGRDWIAGEYSIADIAICPWLRALDVSFDALGAVDWDDFPKVDEYLDRFLDRPAVQRGLNVPPRD